MSRKKSIKDIADGTYVDDEDLVSDDSTPELTAIWNDWQKHQDFLASKNLPNCIKQWEDFYEGRQTKYMPKGLPKVQVNLVRMIIDNKLSAILENPIQISYFSNMDMDSTLEVDRFSNYTLKQIGFENNLRKVCKSALIRGTGFLHSYWNEDAIGMDSIAKGSIEQEEVHVLNVAVANPYEKNLQKQEWVIVAARETVKRAKLMCIKEDSDKSLIIPDDDEMLEDNIELDEGSYCTVLTRYFRKDGEVYFEKGTKNVMLTEPTPLNPYLVYESITMKDRDTATSHSPDEVLEKFSEQHKAKFARYPITRYVLNESSDCYLGISDIYDMLEGQVSVNVLYAVAIKSGIDMQGKWVVRPDALKDQTITNEISQVLTNYSRFEDGIKQITGQNVMAVNLTQLPLALMETIRKTKNSSDVVTGDIAGKEMSGNAIALLQTAAERPTESQTRAAQLAVEEEGKMFLLFFKFYYEQAQYAYDINDFEKYEMRQNYGLPEDMEIPNRIVTKFNGSKFLDMSFDIQAEAGVGGRFSQINQLNFIQSFMQMAPNLSIEMQEFFIKATPSYILKDKKDLLAMIKEQEISEISRLKQENAQQAAVIQAMAKGQQEAGQLLKYMQTYINNYSKQTGEAIANRDKQIEALRGVSATNATGKTKDTKKVSSSDIA